RLGSRDRHDDRPRPAGVRRRRGPVRPAAPRVREGPQGQPPPCGAVPGRAARGQLAEGEVRLPPHPARLTRSCPAGTRRPPAPFDGAGDYESWGGALVEPEAPTATASAVRPRSWRVHSTRTRGMTSASPTSGTRIPESLTANPRASVVHAPARAAPTSGWAATDSRTGSTGRTRHRKPAHRSSPPTTTPAIAAGDETIP